MKTAYLNGVYLPLAEAKISPLDRGFLFGDSVYECIPVYNGECFRLAGHMQRLEQSLRGIKLQNPFDNDQWHGIFRRLIADNGARQILYLQITRGSQAQRAHSFTDADNDLTVFLMSMPFKTPNHAGLSAITATDNRWRDCYIKSTNLLPNVLQLKHAHEQNADEVIFLRDGFVTEAAASNVFIVKDNVIITPPDQPYILPGITKHFVFELAHNNGTETQEAPISEEMLLNADEVWLTSSSKEIAPVVKVNNQPVGHGKPGQLWKKMQDLYQQQTPK